MSQFAIVKPTPSKFILELEERVALDKNHAQHIQIDVTLKKDITNGGEDEEDDEDSNASHHSDEGAEDGEKRSIEMTVALGDFDSNPIIPLLASDNTEIDNQTNNEGNYAEREQEHYNEVQEREPGDVISLSNILRVGGGANLCEEGEGAQRSTSDTSSLLTDRATKRKKVLIEEIPSV